MFFFTNEDSLKTRRHPRSEVRAEVFIESYFSSVKVRSEVGSPGIKCTISNWDSALHYKDSKNFVVLDFLLALASVTKCPIIC